MAMDKSAATSYVYAKASGILARSFVGERASNLFHAATLRELWEMVFHKEVPQIPESLLSQAIETEALSRFIQDYKHLVQNYSNPSKILTSLLHFYDYDNLKEIGAALCMEESTCPELVNISPYSLIKYDQWPDLQKMTEGSSLSWYNKAPSLKEQRFYDYRLDCQYMNEILDAVQELPGNIRQDVYDLIIENYQMINAMWALRLKIYYKMDTDEIKNCLAWKSQDHDSHDELASMALKILEWDTDSYEIWSKWKYKKLLNPHEDGVVWNVDPRWISSAFSRLHVQKAYSLFHRHPFSECPLICYFILKRDETDKIRTASESLRLHMNQNEALNSLFPEVNNG